MANSSMLPFAQHHGGLFFQTFHNRGAVWRDEVFKHARRAGGGYSPGAHVVFDLKGYARLEASPRRAL